MPAALHEDAIAYLRNAGIAYGAKELNQTMNYLAQNPQLRPSYRTQAASPEDQMAVGLGLDPMETSALPPNVPWRTGRNPQPAQGMIPQASPEMVAAFDAAPAPGMSGGAPPAGGPAQANSPPVPKSKITIETAGGNLGNPGPRNLPPAPSPAMAGSPQGPTNAFEARSAAEHSPSRIPVTPPFGAPTNSFLANAGNGSSGPGVDEALAAVEGGGSQAAEDDGSWLPWVAGGSGLAAILAMLGLKGRGGAAAARLAPDASGMFGGGARRAIPDGALNGEVLPPQQALPPPSNMGGPPQSGAIPMGAPASSPQLAAPSARIAGPPPQTGPVNGPPAPPKALPKPPPAATGSLMEEFAPGYGAQSVTAGPRNSKAGVAKTASRGADPDKPKPKTKPKKKTPPKKK